MLKISDFAQIAQVSISALRYYDDIGIFKPHYVDPDTGYRFYTMEQLIRLNRILALKDLGISLDKIVKLVDEDLSTQALHDMLQLRRAQLEEQIRNSTEQLAFVEARIRHMEQEGATKLPEVVVKGIPLQRVVSSYTLVEGFLSNLQYATAFSQLLKHHKVFSNGYTHFIYHDSKSKKSVYDIEIAIPIAAQEGTDLSVVEQEGFAVSHLPEVPVMASVVYKGDPYQIMMAYRSLGVWIQHNKYSISGPCRKICLSWTGDLEDYITEIQFPIRRNENAESDS